MCATVSPVRPVNSEAPVSQESPSWWTSQKIAWYVRASQCSDFHERLACEIANLIPKDKSILEVGCGLGYITEALNRKGYDVFGIDNDEEAIKRARKLHEGPPKRSGSKELFALEDYRTSHRKANVVLAVFCGRIDEEGLGAFEKLADERVVYIVSQHKSNSLRHDRTAGIRTYLEENGYRFTFKELTMHFDQPFESLEEASHFLELQHGNAKLPVKKNEGPYKDQYPYLFENEKRMSLFDIEVRNQFEIDSKQVEIDLKFNTEF